MSLTEAMALRTSLNEAGHETARILTLVDVTRGKKMSSLTTAYMPVINSLEQAGRLDSIARETGNRISAALHFDTGMSRLGLDAQETDWIIDRMADDRKTLSGLDFQIVMSHLTSAEDALDGSNQSQLSQFEKISAYFPQRYQPCKQRWHFGNGVPQRPHTPWCALYGFILPTRMTTFGLGLMPIF